MFLIFTFIRHIPARAVHPLTYTDRDERTGYFFEGATDYVSYFESMCIQFVHVPRIRMVSKALQLYRTVNYCYQDGTEKRKYEC